MMRILHIDMVVLLVATLDGIMFEVWIAKASAMLR